MARGYLKSIADLEQLYYGSNPKARELQKADAPVISTTTGVYNAIYGAQVWSQLNQEANAFGALPKYVWNKSGWRVQTARVTATLGVAENGAIPESVKPTWAEVSTKPKTSAIVFNVSEVQDFLSRSDDDAIGDIDFLRAQMAVEFKEQVNLDLLGDANTVAGNNLESVDRVVASNGEVALVDANDLDIYSLDRDGGATWADAYVNHNSGTDRNLTDTLIRTLNQNVRTNGGLTTFYLTGHDSVASLMGLYEAQVRYNPLGETSASFSINGIESDKGFEFGTKISTVYGIPVLQSKDVVKDTLSRFYALDSSDPQSFGEPRLGIKVAKPTQYFEAGMNSGDPFGINALANEGMYRMMGELICTMFKAQGKIRDLQ